MLDVVFTVTGLRETMKTVKSGHAGESFSGIPVDRVVEVQADGDELLKACKMTGRPKFKTVQKFYGDDAKMIVGNW